MKFINDEIKNGLGGSSCIRRMFEAGIEMKKKYGADSVYDFSLGNPDLPPPPEVKAALLAAAERLDRPFSLGYMPNAGYPALRETLAARISEEQGVKVPAANLLLTCGAAGGINVLFHAVLERGDEVVCPAPYFAEYRFYAANHGGVLVPVPARDFSFEPDIDAMEKAFTPRTRAVLVNSPNNPTGQIYSRAELEALTAAIRRAERRFGTVIYLVSDEPYRFLNFDGAEIPGALGIFEHSVVIGSYSKTISLAGERLGYIAVAPGCEAAAELTAALIMCNRTLGFVNAPALGQQILMRADGAQADLEIYRRRRAAMAEALDGAGIAYTMPRGAFYFFVKSPVPDENEFVSALLEEHILGVPGGGFGCPGYIRLAFCVDERVIRAAAPGFARAASRFRG